MSFWPRSYQIRFFLFTFPWSAPTYLSCLDMFGCLGLACLNDPSYNEAELYEKGQRLITKERQRIYHSTKVSSENQIVILMENK